MEFRRLTSSHTLFSISGEAVDLVLQSSTLLYISLTCSTLSAVRKEMWHGEAPPQKFYHTPTERVLISGFAVWYSCSYLTAPDTAALQKIVAVAERIIECDLPSLSYSHTMCFCNRAQSVIQDAKHPLHRPGSVFKTFLC